MPTEQQEIEQLRAALATAQSQRADFRRQLTAEREGRLAAEKIVDEVRARNRELEAAQSATPAIPDGWVLVPKEPTADMLAAGGLAVIPPAGPKDIALARVAARAVLMKAHYPKETADTVAAMLATMPPFYRAMIAAVDGTASSKGQG